MTKIILDTDLNTDCGDAGALALLHALADAGEAQILGIGVSVSNPDSPAAVKAINAFYGRAALPIGQYAGSQPMESEGHAFVRAVRDTLASPPAGPWPNTTSVYRSLLAAESEGNVTFVAIGFHNTLLQLLNSDPDDASDLNGQDLVAQTVRELVVMGGQYPDSSTITTLNGAEYNFHRASQATAVVCDSWPSPIVFTGFEVGDTILAGRRLVRDTPQNNPVRVAYEAYGYPNGRSAWDETAVIYAVRGAVACGTRLFSLVQGRNTVNPGTGSNVFQPGGGPHAYLVKTLLDEQYSVLFDELQTCPPRLAGPMLEAAP